MQATTEPSIDPINEQLIADLQSKLQNIAQIDHVLASNNRFEYQTRRQQFEQWLPSKGYTKEFYPKLDDLFDNFTFETTLFQDARKSQTRRTFGAFYSVYGQHPTLRRCFMETTPPTRLFQLLCLSFQSISDKQDHLKQNVRDLIALQTTDLQRRLAQAEAKNRPIIAPIPVIPVASHSTEPPLPQANLIDPTQPYIPPIAQSQYPDFKTLSFLVAGGGLLGLSFMQILSPQFALLLGIHFSPVMLVLLVLAGSSLAGYGLYQMEAARHQVPTDGNTNPPQATTASVPPTYLNYAKQCWSFCFKFSGMSAQNNTPQESPAPVRRYY